MKGFVTAMKFGRCGIAMLLYLLVLPLAARAAQPSGPPAAAALTDTRTHKIQVSDPGLAREIEAQGGRLIADYGTYRLYETAHIDRRFFNDSRTELRDDYNLVALNARQLDTRKAEIQALRQPRGAFDGKRMHLIQFAGPVLAPWREQLLATGVRIICYVPENTYLVYGDAGSLAKLQALAANAPHIQWEGEYRDEYRIHPLARSTDANGKPRNIGAELFEIQLVADDAANPATLQLLNQLKLDSFLRQSRVLEYLNMVVRLDPNQLGQIAAQPDVVSILPYFPPKPLCERQDQIVAGNLSANVPSAPGYLAWLESFGFNESQFTNFVVDISDSGVDNGTTSPVHLGLYTRGSESNASRVVYNRYVGLIPPSSTNSLEGCDGHGTINAHIIAGYDDFPGFPFADTEGYHFGLGVCPFVKLGSSVIFDSANNNSFTMPNYNDLQSEAYQSGARISSDSFGANTNGVYDTEAQNFDALVRDAQPGNSIAAMAGNQQMSIVFPAGNGGPNATNILSPGTAKNVITVGAAENVQLFGGVDASGAGDNEASNANEIASFSSRGPCIDGRVKPDLVAPGTHVSGGVIQATNDLFDFPYGIADSCFSGFAVSGGPDGSIFWPTNQQFYTASSGTSQATPCVAGACALVFQYFLNHFTNALPSPAMAKAYLMNSARYMTGATAADTLPSTIQGMGELDLGHAFDGVPRILRDQVPSDVFTNSGEIRSVTGVVVDTNLPLRVTLAWTDAPGSTASSNAWNNNLDLKLMVGTNIYKGNVFNGAFSAAGGAADARNNVESVFLPAGVSGDFMVLIEGTSINSIGVPNTNNLMEQDYALVVYNANFQARPVITAAGTAIVAESCLPTNGIVDPDETVTINFSLQNLGTADTTNLVATLETNSGVLNVSAPQHYGTVPALGPSTSLPFTFTANGSCGETITATLQLQDGTNNLGALNFCLPLGQLVETTTFTENFDSVIAPHLPPGWTTTASGAESVWVTSTNDFDTAPNSAFAGQPSLPGLSELVSPTIPIVTPSAELSFMNLFNLASSPSSNSAPATALDGGVLEIQVDGGSYLDILAAGGTFNTGGYTAQIDPTGDNPLDGRQAWSGDSGGFIPTVVDLPASLAGHNVRFKWRCGTDTGNTNGGTGWYIDSISLQDGYYACCGPLVAPTILNPHIVGSTLYFSCQTVAGQTYTVWFKTNLTDPTWSPLQFVTGDGMMATISDNFSPAPTQRFYQISSP